MASSEDLGVVAAISFGLTYLYWKKKHNYERRRKRLQRRWWMITVHKNRTKLKYNQAEGIVYDSTIGPPSRWFWHGFNQPPQLQLEMVDEKCTEECIVKILQPTPESLKTECARPEDDGKMTAVMFDNCIKQNETQNERPFKPFAIRPKIFKLNEHFSLRIIDRNCIHLLFRDGRVNLKLHLGFTLLRSEIANIVKTEVRNVITPYDGVSPAPEVPKTTATTQFGSIVYSS